MLLVASYIFYGWWDWRFLFLILISTSIDFICALKIYETDDIKRRKFFLYLSMIGNLSILGFFKYFNFFASNLQALLGHCGITIQLHILHIILPLGICFYTFQAMSYVIDVYRRETEATKNFLDYSLFIAFFPHMIAGPIQKAGQLLAQVASPRKLTPEKFGEGCYLIFWGLFQKMFVADNLAKIVEPVFAGSVPYNGMMVLLALYAFAFQIYCDFAGYSDIARGLAKCMGFDFMVNFNLPYFSVNPRQFWQRWHISLSKWFKDYVYIPLGGNQKGLAMTCRNLGITMFLGGLWHGAGWTFIIWGMYQGALIIVHRLLEPLLKKIPSPKGVITEKAWFLIRVVFFFHFTCFGLLIFRAQSITQILNMLHGIVFSFTAVGMNISSVALSIVSLTWLLVLVQAVQFIKDDPLFISRSNVVIKSLFFAACCYLVSKKGVSNGEAFIYYIF
jgi:D-alanyl-lipoteichoic acid acyltransferase DltB (MBOAT superfamily)